ncbi:MAG: CinA family protein [Clostridia bacterium]|nr:CinA family protein [Clostridia bacterium]
MNASSLLKALKEKGLTFSCAESCTAGLVADKIVSVPGASAVFKGGLVGYTNEIKERVLGVSKETLDTHTAVSAETALEMAMRCKALFESDCALSVTGVAGPASEWDEAPVGTVYVGICSKKGCRFVRLSLEGDRAEIRHLAAEAAIYELLCEISQEA